MEELLDVPQPPEGFLIEGSSKLPNGFVIENDVPHLPEGFVLEAKNPDPNNGIKDPLMVAGYGILSGTMGVTQAVKSGELQIATKLPDAGKLALGMLVDFATLEWDNMDRKFEYFKGPEGVKSEGAKQYIQGLRQNLDELSGAMGAAQQLAKQQGGGFSNDLLFGVGQTAPQLAAIIPASSAATLLGGPTAGLSTAAALSGIQSETSVFDEARRIYKYQGFNDEEAEKKAIGPAALAGAGTTALTFLMPGGSEAISNALATRTGQLALSGALRKGVGSTVVGLVKEAGGEFVEEGLDQFNQGLIAKFSYDPNRTWQQIYDDTVLAGTVGGVAGGTIGGVAKVLERGENPDQGPRPEVNLSAQPTVDQIVDEAGGELLTPETLQPQSDEALQSSLTEASQTRPEAARAIQEELDTRNNRPVAELPPDDATEDLNTIPQPEGDLLTDFQLQIQQPDLSGEVASEGDLIGQVQKIGEDEIANGLQDLRPQLVARAERAGVSDPEAVAQDAIIRASKADSLEEGRKFANSTAIENSIADDLRKKNAQMRTAPEGEVSMQQETATGTVGDSLQSEQLTPDQEAVQNEQRSIFDTHRDEFYDTLSPKEQDLWQKINNYGAGRAPSEDQIQQIASKFSKFLRNKGMRDLGSVASMNPKPPKDWTPNSPQEAAKLAQDYSLDKGVDAVLTQIAERAQSPYTRYLAAKLKGQQGRKIGLVPKTYGKWRPYDGLFGYNKGQPSIVLNMSNIKDPDVLENVVLHELIHGQTLDLIDIYNQSPDLLNAKQHKTIQNLEGLMKLAREKTFGSDVEKFIQESQRPDYFNRPQNRKFYGLKNLEEFASEAMSNYEFQELLKSIQVDSTGTTMWTKIVQFLQELLGITDTNTALTPAFENILALVDEGKRFAQLEGRIPNPAGRKLSPAMSPSISAQEVEPDPNKREQTIVREGKTYELNDAETKYIELKARKTTSQDLALKQKMALVVGRGMEGFKGTVTAEEFSENSLKAGKKEKAQATKEAVRVLRENFTADELDSYREQFNEAVTDSKIAIDAYYDYLNDAGGIRTRGTVNDAVMSPSAVSTTPTGMTLPDSVKEAVEWGKENLRARGKFNDPIFQEMMKKDQKAASIMNKVEKDVQELKAVMGEGIIGKTRSTLRGQESFKVDAGLVDRALKGDSEAFKGLPEPVQEAVNSMRQHLDELSRQLIDSGLLSEDLAATVEKNLGAYLNRSYAIFDNPKYKKEALNNPAMAQTIDDARAYLRKYILADHAVGYAKEQAWENRKQFGIKSTLEEDPTWQAFQQTQDYQNLLRRGAQNGLAEGVASDNEVEKEVYRLLDIGSKEGSAAFAGGIPGRKNRNILKRRKDVPIEIRNLWGEYKDPFVNYVRSASKTASLLTNHRFLQNVATQGQQEGWLWTEDDPNRPPSTVPLVAKDPNNKAFDPLAGLYGDEKLREAFQEHSQRADNSWWVRAFTGLTGLSMASKTVLSVQSTVRNFMSNVLFAVGNGYITPSNIGNLATATRAIESNLTALSDDRKQWQGYVQKLIDLGVVGESVSGNTLRELIQRSSRSRNEENMAETMANDMLSKGRKGFMLAGKVYQSVDDFWKVYAFESEKARYREAYPSMLESELDRKVAGIVRDVLPTYSLAPQVIQKLRKFPFMAPFVTFTSEVVRVAYNTVRIGAQEVKDPVTRKIGISRLVGAASAAALFPAISMVLKQLLGFDDDDEDSLRELLPDWQKNSQLILTGKDGHGKISYIDVSYLDPYGYLKQPFTAFGRARSNQEILANTLQAVFSPIFSEQILAGSIIDVRRNKTESGREIYSPQDSWQDQAQKATAHLWEAFEPGTLTSVKRIEKAATGYVESSGRSYKLGNEIASVTLGNRISETDANQGLQQAARRFKREARDASTIFTSKLKNRGTVTPEDIQEAYQDAQNARLEVFRNLRRAYDAAIGLGLTEQEARKALSGEDLGGQNLSQILSGVLRPYRASEDAIGEARRVDKSRIDIYRKALESTKNETLLK